MHGVSCRILMGRNCIDCCDGSRLSCFDDYDDTDEVDLASFFNSMIPYSENNSIQHESAVAKFFLCELSRRISSVCVAVPNFCGLLPALTPITPTLGSCSMLLQRSSKLRQALLGN